MATGDDDEPGSSVDKKIEATLPRPEQTVVARSRKTSHLLGIFKHNEPVAGQKKSDKGQPETIHEEQESKTPQKDEPPSPSEHSSFCSQLQSFLLLC